MIREEGEYLFISNTKTECCRGATLQDELLVIESAVVLLQDLVQQKEYARLGDRTITALTKLDHCLS